MIARVIRKRKPNLPWERWSLTTPSWSTNLQPEPWASRHNRIRRIPLAWAAMLAGKLALPAQDWQTVDDFAITGGDAVAHGVATDAAGRIYVVGTASGHGIVRYSADDGSNWVTRQDYVHPCAANTVFNAVTLDKRGSVFVGGTGGGRWITRRSTDQGVTWETVDDYYRPFQPPAEPGTNGVVY